MMMMMILLLLLLLLLLIIIIIIMIIIALKGSILDFFFTAPRTVCNTYAQVARAQLSANHVQHIGPSPRATCRVPRGTKGQLSY